MTKLHVDSIIKSFHTKQVLTDVYLSCQKGEIVGLLGRNGSGKSTLLKIIFGSMPAERKFVKIGEKISPNLFGSRRLIKYLPQNTFLPSHIKVNTIIKLFCDQKNADTIRQYELIGSMLNKKSKQLSEGEKRFLEIFLIIHSDAAFALLDEPFNGVAPVCKELIKDAMKKCSKDKGFIVTDHDYRSILDTATRIVLLNDGGTKQIRDKQKLADWAYLPKAVITWPTAKK